jgi:hypothetical protein
MKEPLKLQIVAKVWDADNILRSTTDQTYERMTNEDVVMTLDAVTTALTGLGWGKVGGTPGNIGKPKPKP